MPNDKIVAMIPARIGSTRLRMKNLALVNGKPLIFYAIKAAQDAGVFDRVVVNADHIIFLEIAKRYQADFYLRPAALGSSTTKSDDVVYDFMKNYPSDILAWINPICPFQSSDDIKAIINYFNGEKLDTLITVKNEQVHSIYEGKPINFAVGRVFAQTQELQPVQPFVYSVMMWRNKTFIDTFNWRGCAVFCGKVGYYAVRKEVAIMIKTKEDIMLADYIMKTKETTIGHEIKYDELVRLTADE